MDEWIAFLTDALINFLFFSLLLKTSSRRLVVVSTTVIILFLILLLSINLNHIDVARLSIFFSFLCIGIVFLKFTPVFCQNKLLSFFITMLLSLSVAVVHFLAMLILTLGSIDLSDPIHSDLEACLSFYSFSFFIVSFFYCLMINFCVFCRKIFGVVFK